MAETIRLTDITVYCLNHSKYENRRNNIKQLCAKLDLKKVHIISSDTITYNHQKNVAYDSLNLINLALSNNKYPFLILEDDADLIDFIPSFLYTIPEEIHIIYLGSSLVTNKSIDTIKIIDYNDYYYRLYNSLSGHALLIPNIQSALFIKDIYKIAFDTDNFFDIILANLSQQRLFLTPKDGPYFYQNDGRNNDITNFKWKNF